MELNFVTYDEKVLDPIDIDNSEYNDLSYENKILKQKRLEKQREYILTDEVYEKNKLIKKEYQEILLKFLLNNDTLYNKFYNYTTFQDILTQFTTYHAMSTVLDVFEQLGLLEENIVSRYKGISNTYCGEGFRGLLKYEIDNARKEKYDKYGNKVKNKSIDRAYMDAFKTQKEIIEHKILKMLTLFETIFLYTSSLKGKEQNNFSLSKVTHFFETGVKSYFGEQLVEFGFPVDAIKRIEDSNAKLVSMNADLSKKYIK